MKHIYLNLKRFDVPTEYGGVNRIAPVADWAEFIVKNTQEELKKYDPAQGGVRYVFPGDPSVKCSESQIRRKPYQGWLPERIPG